MTDDDGFGMGMPYRLDPEEERFYARREAFNAEMRAQVLARDHSWRQIGHIVVQMFDALDAQDQAGGGTRADRSSPLGMLLHDTVANVENVKARTRDIERLHREALAAAPAAGATGGDR